MAESLFIVPTVWARRDRLQTFLNACRDTIRGDTEIMTALDEEELADWSPVLHQWAGRDDMPWLWSVSAPRMPLGPKMNHHAMHAALGYRNVGFLADDTLPVTEGWDQMLTDALRTPGIAYARSNRRNDVPEHHLVSSVILAALGWYWLPALRHYWADNVLGDIGRAAGCLRYVEAAEIRHEHYDSAPVDHDETYRRAELYGQDDAITYARWRHLDCGADIERVKAVTRTAFRSLDEARDG